MTRELHLEQFESAVLLTWCMARSIAQAVGGFVRRFGSGEAEDLIFFQKHLALHYAENSKHDLRDFARRRLSTQPVLLYRWSPQARRCAADDVCFKLSEAFGAGSYPAELGKVCRLGRRARRQKHE